MFVLLFTSQSSDSSWQFQLRLLEALMHGAVPIIVSLSAPLPLSGLVDWRLATYCIAPQRLPELYFVLRSFAPSDVLEMRRKGRFFLQNYLANTKGESIYYYFNSGYPTEIIDVRQKLELEISSHFSLFTAGRIVRLGGGNPNEF